MFQSQTLINVVWLGTSHVLCPRMQLKVKTVIEGLNEISNHLEDTYNNGVIDGFDDKSIPQWSVLSPAQISEKNKVVLLLGYLHLLLEQGLRRNLKDYSEQPTRGLSQFSIMFPHCYNFSENHWQGRGSLKPWKPHEAWMGLVSLQPHIFWKEIAKIYRHFQVELDELSMISKHLPGQAHLAQSGNNLQHWRVKPPSTWKGCSCKSCIQG